jgi:ankyrin repeat protein
LYFAAKAAQSNVVGFICKLYGDNSWPVDQKGKKGRTALHYAARSGISESVYSLLRTGSKPNIKDRKGLTPLHLAAEHRVGLSNIRKQHKNEERLYWKSDYSGMTELAPYEGRKGRRLPEEQHDLSLAIGQDEESCMIQDVARQLILAGADPTIRDKFGQTAYDVVVLMDNGYMAAELVHHRQAKDLQNPLAAVWHTFRHTNVEGLIRQIDIKIADNYLLMETAVSTKNEASFEALIKAGGNFQARGPDGLTPVHTMAYRGLVSMMKIVAEHIDDLNVFSPPLLHAASSRGQSNLRMVDSLVELCVNVNATYREADGA